MKYSLSRRSTRTAKQGASSTWLKPGAPQRVQVASCHLEKEEVLDNAYDEYCRLKGQNHSVTATQFCERFPSYRKSLRRLIDVHEALEHCGELEDEQWPELCSDFIGYEILHELGVGAMARVYLAAEVALGGRLVALKVSQQGGDEAETLGKLSHLNIVPVHSVQHDPDSQMTAICMPYYGSATLADLLDVAFEKNKLPDRANIILKAAQQREQLVGFVDSPEDSPMVDGILEHGNYVDGVIHLGIQMAEALEYTHQRGILHRDLKPSNVLLTPEGVPMLLDFNLATDADMEVPRLGGTLPYMPVEQIWDVHLRPYEADLAGDPRSDIFSLGAILYELLTGKLPFGDPPSGLPPKEAAEAYLAAHQQAPTPLRKLNPTVDRATARTIERCLSTDVDARPQTVAELLELLREHFTVPRKTIRMLTRIRPLLLVGVALGMISMTILLRSLATREWPESKLSHLALAAMEEKQYGKAINLFDQIEQLRGSPNFTVYLGRGYSRIQTGDYSTATDDLDEAVTLSNDLLVREAAGYAAANSGSIDAAYRHYAIASQKTRGFSVRHLNAGIVSRWKNTDVTLPAICYSRALQGKPGPKPYMQLAYHLHAVAALRCRELGPEYLPSAVAHIDQAMAIQPPYPALLGDAVKIYAVAAEQDPNLVPKFQELVTQAVQAGAAPYSFRGIKELDPWRSEAWFAEAVKQYDGPPANFDYPYKLPIPPSREEILTKLRLSIPSARRAR